MTLADEVAARIASSADADVASQLARYLQVRPGGYGEGDVLVGVRISDLRRIARDYVREPFEPDAWLPVLHSAVHEHRLLTLVVMADRMGRSRGPDDAERAAIYDTYLANTDRVDNWDLVDASAAPVVGTYLLSTGDRAVLDRLAASSSLWERRIAVVATHAFVRRGESADTLRLVEALRGDPEDLVHKACGWMLREVGARVSRAQLRAYLDQRAPQLPRTTPRYAVEHLDSAERRHYLDLR